MANKKYSKELRLEVIQEWMNNPNINIKELAKEKEITSDQVIYYWINRYKQDGLAGITREKSETQLKKLTNKEKQMELEIKVLKQELAKAREDTIKVKMEAELWKESIACGIRLKKSKNPQASKLVKFIAYKIIDKFRTKLKYKPQEMAKWLPISYQNYYKWVKRNRPKYENKWVKNAVDIIKDAHYFHNGSIGNKKMKIWILNQKNIKISVRIIAMIRELNQWNKKTKNINKKKIVPEGKYRQYITEDYLQQNYNAIMPLEKIGVDGTWLEIIIKDKKENYLAEIAYDFFNDKVVSAILATSENGYVVGTVIKDIILAAHDAKTTPIIQMDLGSGNTSRYVNSISKNQPIILSMSHSGFKGNQKTECLNRWFKFGFFSKYGNIFNSYQEFEYSFYEYVKFRNENNIVLKHKMSPNNIKNNFINNSL